MTDLYIYIYIHLFNIDRRRCTNFEVYIHLFNKLSRESDVVGAQMQLPEETKEIHPPTHCDPPTPATQIPTPLVVESPSVLPSRKDSPTCGSTQESSPC